MAVVTVNSAGGSNPSTSTNFTSNGLGNGVKGSIYVFVGVNTSGFANLVPTVTDLDGNTYKLVATINTSNNQFYSFLLVADNVVGKSISGITVSIPSNVPGPYLYAQAVYLSGTATSSVDQFNTQLQTISMAGNISVGVLNTTQQNEFGLFSATNGSFGGIASLTPGTVINAGAITSVGLIATNSINVKSAPATTTFTATVSSSPTGTVLGIGVSVLPIPTSPPVTGVPSGTTSTQQGNPPSTRAQQVLRGAANLYTPSGSPSTSNSASKNISQTGPTTTRECLSAAISNAKFLQRKIIAGVNPSNSSYIIPATEPAAGFFSILPLNGPDNINAFAPQSGAYGLNYFTTNANGTVRKLSGLIIPFPPTGSGVPPIPAARGSGGQVSQNPLINEPLFNGTVHLLNISYVNNIGTFTVPLSDLQTLLAYLQACAAVQLAYCQQWGPCNVSIDPTIYNVTLTLNGNSTNFNDATLGGNPGQTNAFIDTIAAQLGFASGGPTAHCFVVLAPSSVTNTDCPPPVLAYHNSSSGNNIPYIYMPTTQTGLTSNDLQDVYQMGISHELAEMIVDPASDLANAEVCDPCSNCQSGGFIRNYFDTNGYYINSSEFFIQGVGPGFTYNFMTNAVGQPPYGSTGSNKCPDTPYGACGYPPPGQNNPNNTNSIVGSLLSILQGSPGGPFVPIVNILPEIIPLVTVPVYTIQQLIGQAPLPPAPAAQLATVVPPQPPITTFPTGVDQAAQNITVPPLIVPGNGPNTVVKLPLQGY